MKYTPKIQKAVEFAIKVHETDGKQKRKGKDIPYTVHPLTVGLILADAGAPEDVIVAGLLHDTLEDSIEEYKITKEMINKEFGKNVSDLVFSVTEQEENLSWTEGKLLALNHIKEFSNDSVFLKSADVISNMTEIYSDYQTTGDAMFERFNSSKEKILENYSNVVIALLEKWNENPLYEDLQNILKLSKELNANTINETIQV
jgi:(p)ppGpp synthase/HD superfamily hydrolase